MNVKLDQVIMSSLHESFKNYEVLTASITISGLIPTGGASFTASKTFSRGNSVTEISYLKSGGSSKRYVDNSTVLVDYLGGTPASVIANYSTTGVTLTITVSNAGAGYTPASETYDFNIYVFEAPITL